MNEEQCALLYQLITYAAPAPEITYSNDPTGGEVDLDRLLDGRPAWKKIKPTSSTRKRKKVIIVDWSFKHLGETDESFYRALLDLDAELYATTEDYQITPLCHDTLSYNLHRIRPITPTELQNTLTVHNVSRDQSLIIDHLSMQYYRQKFQLSIRNPLLKSVAFEKFSAEEFLFLLNTLLGDKPFHVEIENAENKSLLPLLVPRSCSRITALTLAGDSITVMGQLPPLPHVKKLEIITHVSLTDNVFHNLAIQFPNLEELRLKHCSIVGSMDNIPLFSKITFFCAYHCSVNDQQLNELLLHLPSITHLYIDCANLSGAFANNISPPLQFLQIHQSRINTLQLDRLLAHASSLVSLELRRCEYIPSAPTNTQCELLKLNFNGNKLTDEQLVPWLTRCPHLTDLNISHNNLSGAFVDHFQLKKLKKLNAGMTHITDAQLNSILKLNLDITRLEIDHCTNIKGSFIENLCLDKLDYFSFAESTMNDQQLNHFLKQCPNLKSLMLAQTQHDGSFAEGGVTNQLTTLALLYSQTLNDAQLKKILLHCPQLKYLYVGWCPALSSAFADGLSMSSLGIIDISSLNLTEEQQKGLSLSFPNLKRIINNPSPSRQKVTTNPSDYWTSFDNFTSTIDATTDVPPNLQLTAQQLFLHKNPHKTPHPYTYRLKVQPEYKIGPTVEEYIAPEKQLNPIGFIPANNESFLEKYFSNSEFYSEDVFYCLLPTIPGKWDSWLPLPSLTVCDQLLVLKTPIDLDLAYCVEENLHYIKPRVKTTWDTTIAFLISAPSLPDYSMPPIEFNLQSVRFTPEGDLELNAASEQLLKLNTSQITAGIFHFCKHFTVGELQSSPVTDIEKLNALIQERKGVCRHRALVFKTLTQKLNIKTRLIMNDIHAFIELFNPDTFLWQRVELGGANASLKIKPVPIPILNKANESPQPEQKSLTRSISPIISLPANNPFITWDTVKPSSSHFIAYCNDLIIQAMQQPANRRNILILLDSSQIEQISLQLTRYFKMMEKQSYYLHSLNDVSERTAVITEDNQLRKEDSELFKLIKNASENDALMINWSDYQIAYVGYNTIMDDERKINNTPLPPGMLTIALLDTNKADQLGEDFYSRFRIISSYPDLESLPPRAINNIENLITLEMYEDDHWQSILLGIKEIHGRQFRFKEGTLITAIHQKSAGLLLNNAPLHLIEFRLFLNELLEKRYFSFNGKRIHLPDSFEIAFASKPYTNLAQPVVLSGIQNHPIDYVLNLQTYKYFFQYRYCENQLLDLKDGWLSASHRQGKDALTLLVTENLSACAWARLIHSAENAGCRLYLILAPEIQLPVDSVSSTLAINTATRSEMEEKTISYPTAKLIQTNDINFAEEEVFQPNTLVISINLNTDYANLFEKLEKLPTSDDTLLLFKSKVADAWKHLQAGKNLILKGSISPSLAKDIETLFLPSPFIWINSEKQYAKGQLTLITDNYPILPFAPSTNKIYTQEYCWQKIDEKHQAHALYAAFKQACLALEKIDLSFSYQQLDFMFTKIIKGSLSNPFKPFLRLPQEKKFLNEAKKLWPLKRNKPESKNIEEMRHNKITAELAYAPYVFIAGPPAVGKNTYVREVLAEEKNTQIFYGLDNIKPWLEEKQKQAILYIDRATLEQDGAWDIFEGIFTKTPGLLLNECFHPLTDNQKIVFTGTFERNDHQFFIKHGQAYSFKKFPDVFLEEKIIFPALTALNGINKEVQTSIKNVFLQTYHATNQFLFNQSLTVRNLKTMCMRLHLHLKKYHPMSDALTHMRSMAYIAAVDEVSDLLSPAQLIDLKTNIANQLHLSLMDLEQMYAFMHHTLPTQINNFIVTPSRQHALRLLQNQIELRHLRLETTFFGSTAELGILFEGGAGIGKSRMAIEYLKHTGHKDYYHLTPNQDMEKILLQCFHESRIVIIDEINSLLIERLISQLMSGTDPQGRKAKKPGFFVIGTQNPPTFTGRQVLKDFENYFRKTTLPDYLNSELHDIAARMCPKQEEAQLAVVDYIEARNYAANYQKTPAPTPRHLCAHLSMFAKEIKEEKTPLTQVKRKSSSSKDEWTDDKPQGKYSR